MNFLRSIWRPATRLGILLTAFGVAACSHSPHPGLPPVGEGPHHIEPASDVISEPAAISSVQEALNELGYDAGSPDGLAGPSTRRAIALFQKDYNLVQDGRLTPAVADNIKTRAASLVIGVGDVIVFNDGSSETSATEHTIQWTVPDGGRTIVAVRPSTRGWPSAARTGLDWAITHALDRSASGSSVEWSSTGVHIHFEIRTFSVLSRRETEIAGSDKLCRRFELWSNETDRRYPSLACKDRKGGWFIAGSKIALARPMTEIDSQASIPTLRR